MEHIQLKIWKPTLTNSDFPTVKLQIGPKKKSKTKTQFENISNLEEVIDLGMEGRIMKRKVRGKIRRK